MGLSDSNINSNNEEIDPSTRAEVDRFIRERIDTVPHLEALLLLWGSRPRHWSEEELVERLFVPLDQLRRIMRDLGNHGLVAAKKAPESVYCYLSPSESGDRLVEAVAVTYRRELVRISTMIHSRAPSAVREFARAFEFGRRKI